MAAKGSGEMSDSEKVEFLGTLGETKINDYWVISFGYFKPNKTFRNRYRISGFGSGDDGKLVSISFLWMNIPLVR